MIAAHWQIYGSLAKASPHSLMCTGVCAKPIEQPDPRSHTRFMSLVFYEPTHGAAVIYFYNPSLMSFYDLPGTKIISGPFLASSLTFTQVKVKDHSSHHYVLDQQQQ